MRGTRSSSPQVYVRRPCHPEPCHGDRQCLDRASGDRGAAAPDRQPSNLDAEQALLGAILVNNDAYYRVSDFLEAGHFFEDLHRRIYEIAAT